MARRANAVQENLQEPVGHALIIFWFVLFQPEFQPDNLLKKKVGARVQDSMIKPAGILVPKQLAEMAEHRNERINDTFVAQGTDVVELGGLRLLASIDLPSMFKNIPDQPRQPATNCGFGQGIRDNQLQRGDGPQEALGRQLFLA